MPSAFHLYSLEIFVLYRKDIEVKLPANIANLFDEEVSTWQGEAFAEMGPFNRTFKVSARTKNEADVKVEERAIEWVKKFNNRFQHFQLEHNGLTYIGEVDS